MKTLLKRWKLLVLVVVLALGGFLYYRQSQAGTVTKTLVKPQSREIIESLDVSGNVDATEKADLRFVAASKLMWLNVKEGDTVKKYQALASVDARQMQKQLEIDQNLHGIQFRSTEQTFANNDIYGGEGLTETQRRTVESAQLNVRNTALTVEMQDIAVKNATMISPIEGVVTRVDQPNVGAVIMPTDILEVINPHSVYFAVIVDEADIGKVTASQSAMIMLDAYPENEMPSTVTRVAFTPSTSQSGGLGYKVYLTLPDGQNLPKYRLGMSGDVKIILNKKTAKMSVPTDAITERAGEKSVTVSLNGKETKAVITTGISDGDYTEVLSGLTGTESVVMPTAGK